ncbi:hypothetical protein [Streptomyces sp. PR69]|uniref:hypothetical protein n=1 Tax=Streptomyces sp. PR69 TaxID=2984950 RepID=UPI00226542AD|nr:hypothetical protein [Streptomyces sp. PR69]
MDKKYLVLPCVLVVAAAVMATITLWPNEKKELREKNLCVGALTKETAGLLSDGKGGRLIVEEDPPVKSVSEPVFTSCDVYRANSDGETMRLQYTIGFGQSPEPMEAPSSDAASIGGGRTGWVTVRHGGIQLPESCSEPMGAAVGSRFVNVSLQVFPAVNVHEDWSEKSVIPKIRAILTESADNLAQQYDCA